MAFAIEDILLNFFLILTPLYFFQFILSNYSELHAKFYLGSILGLSAILCMTFPIVSGDGFVWDLRWIALLVSLLYGGLLSGGITATMIVIYRFAIGGMLGSLNVLLVAVFILLLFFFLRRHFIQQPFPNKLKRGIGFSVLTWLIVVSAITVHFYMTGAAEWLWHNSLPIFGTMLLLYVLSTGLYVYFSESIRFYSTLKDQALKTEKLNYVTEINDLLSLELAQGLEKSVKQLEPLVSSDDPGVRGHSRAAVLEISKLKAAVAEHFTSAETEGQPTIISLEEMMEDVLLTLNPYIEQKGIETAFDIDPQLILKKDMLRVKQILLNVTKNAIDATSRGGKVQIATLMKRHHLFIYIEDTGIGIAPEQLASLLDFNSDAKNTIIGRGLKVTQQLIREMDGAISFSSQIGKGTTVSLKLPSQIIGQ